ncbi:hypothetical protein [Bifidobacterium sp. B4142]|uniref:GntT/GntP/DsdX family permease n=1 Tax=Bifidobacterium sp. B4142 TaxID=2817962 RepID=UPI003832EBAD|nr:hypothetical protein [Bifidobacterium sp. B4142]
MLPVLGGIVAIVVLIVLIVHCKLHSFVALINSSLGLGLINGLGTEKPVKSFVASRRR